MGETAAIDLFVGKGVKTFINWRMWDVFSYPMPIHHEEQFGKLSNRAMAAGGAGPGKGATEDDR